MSFTKTDHFEFHHKDEHHDSALDVAPGVENAPTVSPYFRRKRKRELSVEEYVEGITARDITILSQAITLIESQNPEHYAKAQQIIEKC
ncbi:MAG: methylmalonyl Co-A mutase-associated GTPase MeaB, partial [Rikenellaceae bacterium]|nr:methylmalonyl Co-A mutase-associated GTPase MeaB [Rikenellaceae bacterium]